MQANTGTERRRVDPVVEAFRADADVSLLEKNLRRLANALAAHEPCLRGVQPGLPFVLFDSRRLHH